MFLFCCLAANSSSAGCHVLVIVNWLTYYVIEGCAKCIVGNKRWPGVDTGPCLNAGVRGVLKEINTWAFIPGNTDSRKYSMWFSISWPFKEGMLLIVMSLCMWESSGCEALGILAIPRESFSVVSGLYLNPDECKSRSMEPVSCCLIRGGTYTWKWMGMCLAIGEGPSGADCSSA